MLVAITMANIALIFSHRSLGFSIDEIFGRWNAWLWFGLAGVAAILALTLSIPPVRELFRLGALQLIDVGMAAVTSIVLALVLLVFKSRPARKPPSQ
jgi:hypothetical protein